MKQNKMKKEEEEEESFGSSETQKLEKRIVFCIMINSNSNKLILMFSFYLVKLRFEGVIIFQNKRI